MQVNSFNRNALMSYRAAENATIGRQHGREGQSDTNMQNITNRRSAEPAAIVSLSSYAVNYMNNQQSVGQVQFPLQLPCGTYLTESNRILTEEEHRTFLEKLERWREERALELANRPPAENDNTTAVREHLGPGRYIELEIVKGWDVVTSIFRSDIRGMLANAVGHVDINTPEAIARGIDLWRMTSMLVNGINTTQTMSDATHIERAMQREATLRMAAYIAENFMTEAEAANFMAEMRNFAAIDYLVDNGIARIHSDGHVRFETYEAYTLLIDYLSGSLTPLHRDTLNSLRSEISGFLGGLDVSEWNSDMGREYHRIYLHVDVFLEFYNRDNSDWFIGGSIINPDGTRTHVQGTTTPARRFDWMARQAQRNDSVFQNIQRNFDTMLTEEGFSSVNEWNSNMQEMLRNVFGQSITS